MRAVILTVIPAKQSHEIRFMREPEREDKK